MLASILLLGFVVGMQHAFEADHLAAVSALVSRRRSLRQMTRQGALWGLGHGLALVLLCGAFLVSPWSPSARFEPFMEGVVGSMLIVLGGHLLYRLWRDRVHIHVHRHAEADGSGRDECVHLHAHSHRDDPRPHDERDHEHRHPGEDGRDWRTLLVGLTHGAAGSAALTVFLAASLESTVLGVAYILLFALGSLAGMVVLSAAVALPLTLASRRLTWTHRSLQVFIGVVTVGVGTWLVAVRAGMPWT